MAGRGERVGGRRSRRGSLGWRGGDDRRMGSNGGRGGTSCGTEDCGDEGVAGGRITGRGDTEGWNAGTECWRQSEQGGAFEEGGYGRCRIRRKGRETSGRAGAGRKREVADEELKKTKASRRSSRLGADRVGGQQGGGAEGLLAPPPVGDQVPADTPTPLSQRVSGVFAAVLRPRAASWPPRSRARPTRRRSRRHRALHLQPPVGHQVPVDTPTPLYQRVSGVFAAVQ